ncbi:DNA cytosine methyltransferase [Leuconostoc gasicomitatum]|uniref:DNA cytosine methyltransferase n=1 Tax=Leuconostoc gasicomitatum TaxID=115778 RepID=UPI000744A04D|nr:DNA cytosine methyltransferase [Leuconostoc gasicomitatum]MBZ5998519.1 DNA cytosine methyltransferase [Leuconostoc gasicomitatum]CUR63908.1 Type II cytosine-5 DNA methyltransferase [Leuconostoc gasicomitatum KG16-1]
MRFLDLFSGIGGFRLGLERAGNIPVGWVEIDKFARQSYQSMYDTSNEWSADDINKVTDEEWRKFNGKVELIAGGFPCQSFSIAGKREGFLNQTKGTLFFEVARAVKQIKPRFVFLENVKGLLNHDEGSTFRTILNTLDELGYDVEWRVLNSKDFGVPQNRERVYIIGHLREDSGRKVFPFFGENGEVNTANVINPLKGKSDYGWHFEQEVHDDQGLCRTVKANGGSGNIPKVILNNPAKINDLTDVDNPRHGRRGNVLGTDGLSPTLAATDYKQPKQVLVREAMLTSDLRIRKLTPRECWRLQAFPDVLFDKAQQAGLSDSQLYKQAGNSVTVNVIEYIGGLLYEKSN